MKEGIFRTLRTAILFWTSVDGFGFKPPVHGRPPVFRTPPKLVPDRPGPLVVKVKALVLAKHLRLLQSLLKMKEAKPR